MLKCCEQRGSKLEAHQSSPTGKSLLSIQTFYRVSKRSSFSAQGWPDQASQQLCRLPHKGHKLLRLMLSREQRADDQDVAEKPQPVHFPPMEWAGAKAGGGRADPRGQPQCKVMSVSGESGGGADIGPGRVEVAGSEPRVLPAPDALSRHCKVLGALPLSPVLTLTGQGRLPMEDTCGSPFLLFPP